VGVRVLLTSTPGSGHLGPLFPFAHALRRAGHEVLVAAPVSAQKRVERAGLAYLSFADPLNVHLGSYWQAARAAPPEEANEIIVGQVFGGVRARAALSGIELAMDAWRPHVVLRESCEFAGAIAAEAREIPVARVGIGLAQTEDYAIRTAAPVLEDLRAWVGLAPDPEGRRLEETPYLTLTPAALEAPGVTLTSRTLRFHDAAPRPHSVPDPAAPPLVYVTFGTVAPGAGHFPGVYRAAIDALARLPIRIVMTVGDSADPAELGPLPSNALVERWIPQAEVLAQASAVVNHGGFGTTVGTVLAGLPQVIVPLFADQPWNAQRIADLGAGLVAQAAAPETIREAVERVLSESSFRTVASGIAREAFLLPPIDAVASSLAEMVESARERRVA
jgi:UDP:flavonoid glycosyltransferase YjiC (YdhE family)